jgi:2-deoxy-D-gluconate 3-dehydrogenase
VNNPSYTASKGGIGQLTKALANEWAAKGVNDNAIASGYFATDINPELRADPAVSKSFVRRIPRAGGAAGRYGRGRRLPRVRGVVVRPRCLTCCPLTAAGWGA